MSSNINFTPFHTRFNNEQNTNSFNYNLNNENNQYNFRKNQNSFSRINNNYFANNYINNNYMENNNMYNSCYILITGFDEHSKETLFNFINSQGINTRDLKILENEKILIKFQNERYRNMFIDDYEKVKDNFFGVKIQFINENEKERLINNNASRVIHNISYNNNYMSNNESMVKYPKNKSNLQKFLDVFFNL